MYSISSFDNGQTLTALTNNSILRSEDSGSTWIPISDGAGSNTKITGTGVINAGVMIDYVGNINYTSDNGKTFSYVNSAIFHQLNDIVINSESGIGYISGYKNLLKTTDHGQKWFNSQINDSLLEDFYFSSINMLDSNKIFVAGLNINNNNIRKLFKSNDGFESTTATDLPFYYLPHRISFYDETIGIANSVYEDRSMGRTTDGGLTWNKIIIPDVSNFYEVKFVNDICIATSLTKIHVSSDLGLTWTTHNLNDGYSFTDIYSPSPGQIFLSGYRNVEIRD